LETLKLLQTQAIQFLLEATMWSQIQIQSQSQEQHWFLKDLSNSVTSGSQTIGSNSTAYFFGVNIVLYSNGIKGRGNIEIARFPGINSYETAESSIILGKDNVVCGHGHLIAGHNNYANNKYTVCTGYDNKCFGEGVSVVGGKKNRACGWHSSIFGSYESDVMDEGSVIVGGKKNIADGKHSVIAGGHSNKVVRSDHAFIAGGSKNKNFGDYGAIVGGLKNEVEDVYGAIFAGQDNAVAARVSILGSWCPQTVCKQKCSKITEEENFNATLTDIFKCVTPNKQPKIEEICHWKCSY